MKRSRKIFLIIGGIVVLLVIIALVSGPTNRNIQVETEQSIRRSIVETVSASGKVQPEIEVKISAEVSGLILELPVREGDIVEAGDLLVGINPDLYTSALNRAEAAVNSARSTLASARARKVQAEAQLLAADRAWKRSESLFNQGAISQAEYDQAKSTYEVSQAEVEAAEQSIVSAQFSIKSAEASRREAADNLKRTTLKAPQRGTVTALTKEAGEAVLGTSMMQGETIMKISDLRSMEVKVEVNESDIVRVSLGDTAKVEVDAFRGEQFKGVVTEIGNTALNAMGASEMNLNQVTNFGVKIRILTESYAHLIENEAEGISPFRPGMSATVEIQTNRADNVLSVPIKAVTTRSDTSSKLILTPPAGAEAAEDFLCVFVIENGESAIKVVETGIQDSQFIEITSGLSEDMEVITGPYELVSRRLRNGQSVETSSGDTVESEE